MLNPGIHTISGEAYHADPLPPTVTDDEIQTQIARELAERGRALEGGEG